MYCLLRPHVSTALQYMGRERDASNERGRERIAAPGKWVGGALFLAVTRGRSETDAEGRRIMTSARGSASAGRSSCALGLEQLRPHRVCVPDPVAVLVHFLLSHGNLLQEFSAARLPLRRLLV